MKCVHSDQSVHYAAKVGHPVSEDFLNIKPAIFWICPSSSCEVILNVQCQKGLLIREKVLITQICRLIWAFAARI